MSHSVASDSSSNVRNVKPTEKQTSIFTYFARRDNVQKRKRRNLDADTDTKNATRSAASDDQVVDVLKDKHPSCQFESANDDKCDRVKSDSRLQVCASSTICSLLQSDSDSPDVIPPSPVEARKKRITFNVKKKSESHEHVTAFVNASTDAADHSETAVLTNSVLNSNSVHCAVSSAKATSEHQPKVKDYDGHVTSFCNPAHHFSEVFKDDIVSDSELLSLDIFSRQPTEADTTSSSRSPVTVENAGNSSEDTESYLLQFDYQAAKQQFMKVVTS